MKRELAQFPAVKGELLPATHHPPTTRIIKIRPMPPAIRLHTTRAARAAGRQTARILHPVTLAQFTWIAIRGLLRIIGATFHYLTGNDKGDLRKAKPDKHHELTKNRQIGVLILLAATALALYLSHPAWTWAAGGILLSACVAVGRQKQTLLAPTPNILGPHDTMIREAFVHANLAKEPDHIKLTQPIQREGATWSTVVELPPGISADKAISQRKSLASALRVPSNRLFISSSGHDGSVRLRVCDSDPLAGPPNYSPLSAHTPIDLWKPLPIGIDDTGQQVSIDLVFSGILIGGLPRRGKTVLATNVLLGALLDPHCELWLVDGKGLDSAPLIPFATRHVGNSLEEFSQLMDDLETEMDRRYARLATLEVDKLTRHICHAEMPLIMLSIDELARYSASSEKLAKKAMNTLRNIVSVGPACGIIPVLATQKPSSKIVPTDIRDLIPIRAAVLCSTGAQSRTILGDESTVSAVDLPASVRGAAWLVEGEESRMFRPFLVDGVELRKVTSTLSALPRETAEPVAALLSAMRGEERVPSAVIAERMNINPVDLSCMLRPYNITPKQLGGPGNPRGYKMSDIQAAM